MSSSAERCRERPALDLQNCPVFVRHVIYANADNGFVIAKVRPETGESADFTAQGYFGEANAKDRFLLSGYWKDTSYGKQLMAVDVSMTTFSGGGLLAFLASGAVKGIGEKLAARICAKFGDEAVRIFEEAPDRLCEIKGITQKKLEKIIPSWQAFAGTRAALMSLNALGLPFGIAKRILSAYETPALALHSVRQNPYMLAWDVDGIGFIEADRIAGRLGLSPDGESRRHAAVGYVLQKASEHGHCFLQFGEITQGMRDTKVIRSFENIGEDEVKAVCAELALSEKVKICDQGRVYLTKLYRQETGTAFNLGRLASDAPRDIPSDVTGRLNAFCSAGGLRLHPLQAAAVQTAVRNKISLITGGPGTGKTTLIKALLHVLAGKNVALCAPTGRAAKKMTESTGVQAKTIHRLLEYSPQFGFGHCKDNPLDADVVIVDEASMLDIFLAKALTDALSYRTSLVFVGDIDQLPPVGPGQVFADLIASECFPVARLKQVYRQSEGSYIALNAGAVREGNYKGMNISNQTEDFFWMPVDESREPAEKQKAVQVRLVRAVDRFLELGYPLAEIQVLTPMREGAIGVESLNQLLQDRYNPHGEEVYAGRRHWFRAGDRVMQCRNDYTLDVFNGDVGVITGRDCETGEIHVDYDGRLVAYNKEDMRELALAYASTIHKAQGGETRVVIQIVSKSHYIMLTRSLLYTGVTRARERCVLIGEKSALAMCIKNNRPNVRHSGLVGFLRSAVAGR
jgi:exodeoxyribonuclease V alpha subunit